MGEGQEEDITEENITIDIRAGLDWIIKSAKFGYKNPTGQTKEGWLNAKKITLHIWVAKNKPKPKVCEICKEERKLNLANIKGHKYTRRIEDYRWLCYSCHRKMDITHCKRGHKLEGDNIYIDTRGKRVCKQCRKIYSKNYRDKLANTVSPTAPSIKGCGKMYYAISPLGTRMKYPCEEGQLCPACSLRPTRSGDGE